MSSLLKDDLEASNVDEAAWASVDQRLSPPSKSSNQPLTPLENNDPSLPKTSQDDNDSSSELSPAPSPLGTRPTSSKTSVDEGRQPTPATAHENTTKDIEGTTDGNQHIKADEIPAKKTPSPKATPEPRLQTTPSDAVEPDGKVATPTKNHSSESPSLPDRKLSVILELNAELIRVYNEFLSQGQAQALAGEFKQYYARIQHNIQWLVQVSDMPGAQVPPNQRIPTPILTPPPSVPFTSIERIAELYALLPQLFEKETTREAKKKQYRHMMANAMTNGTTSSSPTSVNSNGKRERPEDMNGDSTTGSGDASSPRKRVDTGDTKSLGSLPSSSPSPSTMNATPTGASAPSLPPHTPTTVGMRPSSSHSNASSAAGHVEGASHAPTPSITIGQPPSISAASAMAIPSGPGGMAQHDRLRMLQHSRVRALSGGAQGALPLTMNGQPHIAQNPNPNPHPNVMGANPQNPSLPAQQQPGAAGSGPFGASPSAIPPALFPKLLTMVQNPQAHPQVGFLYNKIPNFKSMPPEQQAGLLYMFQQNQSRGIQQQQQMQQHQQQQMPPPSGMPGQPNGYPAGMRPPSVGNMQPPPAPHLSTQRQLNLIQQQQTITNRGLGGMQAPGSMGMPMNVNVNIPMGAGQVSMGSMGGMMGPGMGMNNPASMGMAGMNPNMGMGMGGHARMPSNPSMAPPPPPGPGQFAQQQSQPLQQQQQAYAVTSVNPMNLSYPSQQSPQSQQSPPNMNSMNAGSPPNPNQGWNSMSGGGSFSPMGMTPAAILQQQAKMGSPSPGPSGGGNMDPNMVVNWQDLTT